MLIPNLFRFLFQFSFFKKRYFGIYKKLIQPKGLFKGKTVISSYDETLKIKLDIEEWIQQQIFLFGYFDEVGINFLKKNLAEGSVFIDVGTNIGSYSLIASKLVGANGKVISFEPSSLVFNRLLENTKLNKLTNITLEKKALLDQAKKITLHTAGKENSGTTSIYHHTDESGNTEEVEGIVFDEYIQEKKIEKIDFIKMDIEGAEYYALQGMKQAFLKFKPIILIEISDEILEKGTYSKKELIAFFLQFGYTQHGINAFGELIPVAEQNPNYHNFVFK